MVGTTRKQNLIVLILALSVIAGSIFLTLYASGVLFTSHSASSNGYQNVTFTDAVVTCHEAVKENYGRRIRNLVTDNHSSRFDDKSYLYKIFLQMDLHAVGTEPAKLYYVNCFVRSGNGSVRKLEVMEDVDTQPQPAVDDGTNMFGMPKPK